MGMAKWLRECGAPLLAVALAASLTGCPLLSNPPTAAFSADPVTGFVPLEVDFTDESEANGSAITAWAWDFGDGSTSDEQNPTHTYELAGVYTVKLTATNAKGSDEITKADLITVEARRAEISLASSLMDNVTTGDAEYTATGQVLVLDGGPMPADLLWVVTNDADESNGVAKAADGSVVPAEDGTFSATVPLTPGDNVVTFRIPFTEIEASLTVTYNPGFAFGGQLSIWPDTAYVGELRQHTALIALPAVQAEKEGEEEEPPAAPAVMLVRIVDGAEQDVAQMTDDGDLGRGDEIEGDGIYSGLFELEETEPNTAQFRVRVTPGGEDGSNALSEIFPVLVTERITEKRFEEITTQLGDLETMLEEAAATKSAKAVEDAVDDVIETLEADPTVTDVGESDSGNGVWLVYEDGIPAVLYAPTSDIKSGGRGAGAPTMSPIAEATEYPHYEHYFKAHTSSAQRSFELRADEKNTIKSNKARVIAAQYFDWGDNDDIPTMEQILRDNGCFEINYTKYASKGSGSVEDFKNLGDYGLIFISSHGDSFFHIEVGNWSHTSFGWDGLFGQVVLHSNMAVTAANKTTYEDDLKKGRLALWGKHYGILPGFIRTYAGSLPNSYVHMSICRGAWNGTMAKAFLDKGAGAFTGYDEYVSVSFCKGSAPPVLTELLKPDKTMADAFTPGQTDPVTVSSAKHPAEFKLFGSNTLAIEVGSLKDGGFESNSVTQAWTVDGDARIVPQLGASGPTEGGYMGIISTGLGFTTQTGTLSQDFCLGAEPSTISFDWNFFSEEFMEWVGSQYQDSFQVTLTDVNDGTSNTVLVSETVDSLSGGVSKVDNSFDRGDVYATGWRNYSGAIPEAMLGKRVRLQFYTTDVGDSIYDTAVLIDDIKIEPIAD